MPRLRFHPGYFVLTVILFITEVLIALYVHDRVVRPYIGDILVVMLIYCFIQSFFDLPTVPTIIAVLTFSFMIETLQYAQIVDRLGLADNRVASTVIGNSFAWMDIWMYILGGVFVFAMEAVWGRQNLKERR